jgi:hypothetical protein
MTQQRSKSPRKRLRLVPLPERSIAPGPAPLESCRQRWFTERWAAPHQLALRPTGTEVERAS